MSGPGARAKSRKRDDGFDWSGGHPALDLVNTLDERPSGAPIDRLASYSDLLAFAVAAAIVSPALARRLCALDGRAAARIVRRTRVLREHLHGVLSAVHLRRPVRRVNVNAISAAIRAAHAAHALDLSPARRLARYRWAPASSPAIPLHACALAVEDLLLHHERGRIRKCGASDCDVYFLDTSKSQVRHWCSMTGCGNREKQRRRRLAGH
jgi:predicted RNA-binding Zn ribbon-like protein